jgi:hypothetical protein
VPVYKQQRFPYIEVHIAGRRFRRSSKTTSKRKAQALEWDWRKELAAPAAPAPGRPRSSALDDRYSESVIRAPQPSEECRPR